jgi:inorganic pyrophosphatase
MAVRQAASLLKYALVLVPGLLWIAVALGARAMWPTTSNAPPLTLPAAATRQLATSLEASAGAAFHVWRDIGSLNSDGSVNAYIEIARGDHRKWEFDMRLNARAVDRIMPKQVGGYPVNYGFVPQTVSYDGDPFDAVVLGPPIEGGTLVRGAIVGLLHMTDEKGLDSKVVLALVGADGRPEHRLTDTDRRHMAHYFSRYKRHEAGKFSTVGGWDTPAQGLAFVRVTHAFFRACARRAETICTLTP